MNESEPPEQTQQPLSPSQNTACRGCQRSCLQCPWAFPESFAPIKMLSIDTQRVKQLALKNKVSSEELLRQIIESYFENKSD